MANNRSKSLFRGPNVKHFALVHRSVRDPLSNDPESSDRVLAEVQRGSSGKVKGKSKADLEDLLGDDALAGVRANEGEAATYGILYDDSEYDYMQHLRKIGDNDIDGSSGFLVEAPRKNDVKGKGKAKQDGLFALHEDEERARELEEQQSYRDYLEDATQEAGLRPDMDPALREILEALEDDAYVDDAAADGDIFGDLLNEKADTAYRDHDEEQASDEEIDDSLTARIARHRASRPAEGASDDEYSEDEERDTVTDLKPTARPPRKSRTAGSTAASSAFSMSSSSMFRNDGLRTLDDRFDQVEAMYADSDDDEASGSDTDLPEEVNEVFDDFLENYKVVGKKMIPSANTEDVPALEILRSDMNKLQVLESVKRQERDARLGKDTDEVPMPEDAASRRNKWDCETVLSNYSNLENHPRIISLQKVLDPSKGSSRKSAQPVQRISIDPKTGFPVVEAQSALGKLALPAHHRDDSDEDMSEVGSKRQTVTRPRDETPEQKKARKAEVKAAQQERRSEKAKVKQSFGVERKRQLKGRAGRLADAADVGVGNVRGIEVMRLT